MAESRVILKARFYDCEPDMYPSVEAFYATLEPGSMEAAMVEARAAMEAMREPTKEMIDAGARTCHSEDDTLHGDYLAHRYYSAMIEAAREK